MNEYLLTPVVFHAVATLALTVGAAISATREMHHRRVVPLHTPDWHEHPSIIGLAKARTVKPAVRRDEDAQYEAA
jgi:hypothetical protein